MMKRLATLTSAALVLLLAAACGDSGEVEAGSSKEGGGLLGKLEDADLSNLSGDAIKGKANDAIDEIAKKLGEIKDGDTAKKITEVVTPVIEQLKGFQTSLGDKMPDLSALKKAATDLSKKFTGDADVMATLKPLLDKLTALTK